MLGYYFNLKIKNTSPLQIYTIYISLERCCNSTNVVLITSFVIDLSFGKFSYYISLDDQVGNTLIIWVQAQVRKIHSDSGDHFNGGPVSLGHVPSGT